jgi:cytochrome P450
MYSYIPFLGGKRVCVGKTFAEVISKFVLPIFLTYFDFDFVNEDDRVNKKPNNIAVNKTPPIMIKLKKSNLLA